MKRGRRKMVEIRVSDCWNFSRSGPFSNDLALIYFNKPVPEAEEGFHYLNLWDPEEHIEGDQPFDLEGEEFILAGFGMNGPIKDNGDESHLKSIPIFHRGYNEIESIQSNLVYYDMTRPEDGGLEMESMAHYGDSGSGALYEKDGQKYLIGVKSHGGDAEWDTWHAYTWTGGPALDWIRDNMNRDLDNDPYIPATQYDCQNWNNLGNALAASDPGLDYGAFEVGATDEYFDCPCDCEEDDTECLRECHRCLGWANFDE